MTCVYQRYISGVYQVDLGYILCIYQHMSHIFLVYLKCIKKGIVQAFPRNISPIYQTFLRHI